MKFRELRRFVFGFCLLAGFMSLTGCHADPAKGSNEKWLSQVDTQAVIVGENYYMADFDQNQIMIWNFSDRPPAGHLDTKRRRDCRQLWEKSNDRKSLESERDAVGKKDHCD